jgi:Protein of unknown function (DUF1761)
MTLTLDFTPIFSLLSGINWISNIVAVGVALAIGVVWYHTRVFGKTWRRLANLELQDVSLRQRAKTAIIWQTPMLFVLAIDMSAFLQHLQWHGAIKGMILGYNFGMFVALFIAIHYLYDMRPPKLFFITAGYSLVALSAMGLVIGAML